jgi:hypothetical protein
VRHKIQPRVVGEFDDGALMTAFGREGRGVFMSPSILESETVAQFGVEVLGRSEELVEEFFAVSVERRTKNSWSFASLHCSEGQPSGASALPPGPRLLLNVFGTRYQSTAAELFLTVRRRGGSG